MTYIYPQAVLVDTGSGDVVATGPDGELLSFAGAQFLADRLNENGFPEVKAFTLTPGTPARAPGARLLAETRERPLFLNGARGDAHE